MGYAERRAWSDQFIPAIKRIVGPLLLTPSTFDVDVQQATDLIVLTAKDMRIAARVRRNKYAMQYPYEFTVRSRYDGGCRTELQKLVDGWGDWMFYGHAEDSCAGFVRWMVIDLSAWRAHLIRDRGDLIYEEKSNGDGTHFVAFDVRSFQGQPPLLVASSFDLELKEAA